MRISTVIFGGGAAGLWLLDELTRRGVSAVVLEAGELGRGQTLASQGILHGGLKYTLQGLLTKSAAGVREMPAVWRSCLAGERAPELTDTPVRTNHCYLWRTDSVTSKLGMIGAKMGLRVAPKSLRSDERPAVLRDCPGNVARLDEQVISPAGLIANLAERNRGRILKINANSGLRFRIGEAGHVDAVLLRTPDDQSTLRLEPDHVVLTAGAGNAKLREQLGLTNPLMQRRPLHMVILRGDLPTLNGHCVDGKATRVTITSDRDSQGRVVWQVGGRISEEGVALESNDLIRRTKSELESTLPALNLSQVEWATYRVDRAEVLTRGTKRPASYHHSREANIITAWPTKLVLVPALANEIADDIGPASSQNEIDLAALRTFPHPRVASPPWETTAFVGGRNVPERDKAA